MNPVIMSKYITARLPNVSTMDLSHIVTPHITGLIKQARQIHSFPIIRTAPLISLGVLCDDGCTITLDKQENTDPKNGQQIIKGTRNKQTGMW